MVHIKVEGYYRLFQQKLMPSIIFDFHIIMLLSTRIKLCTDAIAIREFQGEFNIYTEQVLGY